MLWKPVCGVHGRKDQIQDLGSLPVKGWGTGQLKLLNSSVMVCVQDQDKQHQHSDVDSSLRG